MHLLTDKKLKIYFYLIFFIFLSSIFNFELKKNLEQFFLIKNIQYENKNPILVSLLRLGNTLGGTQTG